MWLNKITYLLTCTLVRVLTRLAVVKVELKAKIALFIYTLNHTQ